MICKTPMHGNFCLEPKEARMTSTPRIFLSFILFLFFSGMAHAQTTQWLSYEETLKRALEEDKLIYLYFYSERCPWCVRMDHDVLNTKEVGSYLNEHFLSARIRVEEAPQLANLYRVRGFPTHIFLREKAAGILVSRPGYIPDGSFLRMLQFIQAEKEKNDSSK